MADEVKQEAVQEEKKDGKKMLSTLIKFLLGVVFLILGLVALIGWWKDLLVVLKGCVGLFLLLAALITFAIAKE